MATEEFCGAVVLEVDGQEIDCTSLSVQVSTGRSAVKTMNRKRQIAGFKQGVTTYELSLTVVVPKDGKEPNWAGIERGKVTRETIDGTGERVSYLDCFTVSVGHTFDVDNEARKSITMIAAREVKE
jgi:uncharacterized protein YunC (DUF1805 family)